MPAIERELPRAEGRRKREREADLARGGGRRRTKASAAEDGDRSAMSFTKNKAPKPGNEAARLDALRRYKILDTPPEEPFDDLTLLAARICEAPVALISLIDADRQWFKSKVGLSATETSRDVSFCAYAITQPDLFVVPDALADERFATNPFVISDPHIRFYAGVPLVTPEGDALGTLCIIDYEPRELSAHQEEALRTLARQVVAQLEMRRGLDELAGTIAARDRAEGALRHSEERYRMLVETMSDGLGVQDGNGLVTYVNDKLLEMSGFSLDEMIGRPTTDFFDERNKQVLKEQVARRKKGDRGRYEIEWTAKDGRKIPTIMSPQPIFDAGGHFQGSFAVITDITERKQAEEALRKAHAGLERRVEERTTELRRANKNLRAEIAERKRAEELFQTLTNNATAGIFIVQDGKFQFVNPEFQKYTGYTEDELLGRDCFGLIVPEDQDRVRENAVKMLKGERSTPYEYRISNKHGEIRWIMERVASIHYQERQAALGSYMDITERKRAEETIGHLAYHDALTALPNWVLFQDRFTLALAQARRNGQSLAVMSLDLDRFKLINDALGHVVGDQLLQAVAKRLESLVPEGDTVARVGGDEFMLLLPGTAAPQEATRIADKILESLRRPFQVAGQELHATTSIGISLYPRDGKDAKTLLKNADAAMYRAKEKGRDNCQLYTAAMKAKASQRVVLESELRRAVERQEFVVHYQPQVSISSGQVVGLEALVRWQHPIRGLVAPGEFIPLAEEAGLIVPLGEWVLRTACAQNKAWQQAALAPLRVAVNLSARQLQQPILVEMVTRVLKESGLAPHYLRLEITEGVVVQDVDLIIPMLRELRRMGVEISIDDFGTGYSSLSYLRRLPIDEVKIDRSFVRDITVDPGDAAIVTAMVALGQSLKLRVIAEGVETEAQLAFLKERQCDEYQGYLFAKPAPAEAVEKMLMPDKRVQRRSAIKVVS